ARSARLAHDGIDLFARRYVVPEGEFRRRRRALWDAAVVRDAGARPERQPQPSLQVDEDHRAVLELRSVDAVRGEAEPFAVEVERALQVVDAEGEDGDARQHGRLRGQGSGRGARGGGKGGAGAAGGKRREGPFALRSIPWLAECDARAGDEPLHTRK